MDVLLNPASGATQSYKPPVAQTANTDQASAAVQPIQKPQQPAIAAVSGASSISNDVQAQYETAIRQAVLSFKNTYAVSDKELTIFKDVTGQYITRYISLRDGSVTYVPAPVFMRDIQAIIGNTNSLRVAIEA